MKPLAIDLYCGLGGWAEGFLSEGYRVIGFDIEQFDYPGELVLRDVMSISGAEIVMRYGIPRVIVASPPCQEPSYRAMPWTRAQKLNRKGPPFTFIQLFEACFRIRLEVSVAARFTVPLVIENVRGARRWVGWSKAHFGSYYLWGDVPADLPKTSAAAEHAKAVGIKHGGDCFSDPTWPGKQGGTKQSGISGPRKNGKGDRWFQDGAAQHGSKSAKRKAASAAIAKIPFPLAQHIARCFKPEAA